MQHKRYDKIMSLGKEETEGLLSGMCYVQEKIDGANLSIWKDEDGIYVGSRTQTVGTPTQNTGFRGAVDYVNKHEGIKGLLNELADFPDGVKTRLYGEWLVKHTITNYSSENYNHFYLFDIEIEDAYGETFYYPIEKVYSLAEKYGIKTPALLLKKEAPSLDELRKLVGVSKLGPVGEGIVIKNYAFINKFGNHCHAKAVSEAFKEDNKIVFGNASKASIDYNEVSVMDLYCTEERVRKIMNKIEQNEACPWTKQHIAQTIGMVQYDVLTEEIWAISKKFKTINFPVLKALLAKKTALLAISISEQVAQ